MNNDNRYNLRSHAKDDLSIRNTTNQSYGVPGNYSIGKNIPNNQFGNQFPRKYFFKNSSWYESTTQPIQRRNESNEHISQR
jgi:hypothetical protein